VTALQASADPDGRVVDGPALGKARFVRGRTVPSLIWGSEGPDFHTRISVFNYYSLTFADRPVTSQAYVYAFDENGRELGVAQRELGPLEQWQVELSAIAGAFQGLVAVQLVPDYLPPLKHERYVGTLFFATYWDAAGHMDFTHETDRMRFEDDSAELYWSTLIPSSERIDTSIIVQNSFFGEQRDGCDSAVEIEVRSASGRTLLDRTLELAPRESRVLALSSLLPEGRGRLGAAPGSVHVRGRHINMPMTLLRHSSGDFNVHHF